MLSSGGSNFCVGSGGGGGSVGSGAFAGAASAAASDGGAFFFDRPRSVDASGARSHPSSRF